MRQCFCLRAGPQVGERGVHVSEMRSWDVGHPLALTQQTAQGVTSLPK